MRTENEIEQQTASDRLYVGMQFALRREALGLEAEFKILLWIGSILQFI